MARGGEQVLAAVSLLTVEIRVDLASTDTQGGVEEGDGILGGAGAAVRVRVRQSLQELESRKAPINVKFNVLVQIKPPEQNSSMSQPVDLEY